MGRYHFTLHYDGGLGEFQSKPIGCTWSENSLQAVRDAVPEKEWRTHTALPCWGRKCPNCGEETPSPSIDAAVDTIVEGLLVERRKLEGFLIRADILINWLLRSPEDRVADTEYKDYVREIDQWKWETRDPLTTAVNRRVEEVMARRARLAKEETP